MELENLFKPGKIGSVTIKNRIVRSATYDGNSDRGFITEKQIQFYEELARGGTGLIITGATVVDLSGSGGKTQAYILDDSFMDGQKKLVIGVHDHSEVKIAIQLMLTGRQGTHPKFPPIAPSAVPNEMTGLTPRELSSEEIKTLIKCFVDSGRRAYEWGYDMIQLHAAHDYFLNNFICPHTNTRTDEYGGNTEKRTKILVEIYHQLREEVDKTFPIFIKLQTIDGFSNGIDLEEAKKIAEILVKTGFDAIEPSGGSSETMTVGDKVTPSYVVRKPEEENYFLDNAKEIKTVDNCCPIILVGGIRNPLSADQLIKDNIVDFISMSRPFIREPNLPNRWMQGDLTPATCISCNQCYMTMMTGPIYCVPQQKLEKRAQRKIRRENK